MWLASASFTPAAAERPPFKSKAPPAKARRRFSLRRLGVRRLRVVQAAEVEAAQGYRGARRDDVDKARRPAEFFGCVRASRVHGRRGVFVDTGTGRDEPLWRQPYGHGERTWRTDMANGETCDDGNTVTEACAYGLMSCSVCNAMCRSVGHPHRLLARKRRTTFTSRTSTRAPSPRPADDVAATERKAVVRELEVAFR